MIREATHAEAVWRERSNFVIATAIESANTDITTEQLWARKIDEAHFELCCVPFFAYDIALGDVVETDSQYMVKRVVHRSGRFVFRVWFGDSFQPRREVADQLEALGALLEWSSPNLLAVDAADEKLARTLSGWLLGQEQQGHLVYETGKTA